MRQEARLRQPVDTGGTVRSHLTALARMGKESARRELEVPPCPPQIQYLVEMAQALWGRSGASQVGLLPLSPTVLKDFCILTGEEIEPHEVEALFLLDAVMLHPGKASVTVEQKPKRTAKELREAWANRGAPIDA